ncbi:anti sigma factor C-terminal domain-containing protein [Brevibacillus daliensis]|uniref:anti sigma factor C-terminal domain-containing protein n=1 Tax=Brevibacillus daliensis TaxID=2892995 RepID=UPI001E55AFCD|nr:anti sigma factor C-terminal domain-containing protein [Brevibacillus daliensis]
MNDNQNDQVTKLIKKAKRKTIWRNVAISTGVTLVLLVGGTIGNAQLLHNSFDTALMEVEHEERLAGPNVYMGNYQRDYGILKGNMHYQTYKVIEGVPLPWQDNILNVSAWGTHSLLAGSYNSLQFAQTDQSGQQIPYARPYNPHNGQREMMFYIPEVDYGKRMNEQPTLSQLDKNKLVEMGLSFDKAYSFEQIKEMLPEGVRPVWYWVDTYADKNRKQPRKLEDGTVSYSSPEHANMVYGFGTVPDQDPDQITPKGFIEALETGIKREGKYANSYQKAYDYLRKDKPQPDESDMKIIGVVVTGTAENLQKLSTKTYIHGAVLGAIVDR